jgi:hypothetical protein
MKLSQNAELKRQFDTYRDSFVVGKLLTLAAFTSVSLLDSVAEEFSDHVMFTFIRVRGVIIRALSQVPREAEVLVPPPSVFRIRSVAKFHGSLTVTLECVDDNPLTYLSPAARECMLMCRCVAFVRVTLVVLSVNVMCTGLGQPRRRYEGACLRGVSRSSLQGSAVMTEPCRI